MEKQIYVQRINGKNSPAVPATLSYAAHGPGCLITIRSSDGLAIRLAGTHRALLAALEPMLEAMRRALPTSDPQKLPGVIRAEAEPDPAAVARRWFTRGEQPQPQRKPKKPQAHELTGDPVHDWPLWLATFGDSAYLSTVMKDFFRAFYQTDPDKLATEPGALPALPALAGPPDHQDLALVLAGGEDGLWKADGSLNQSEIARRLGIKNSGPSNRDRILAVVEALLSSSTPAEQPGQRSNSNTQAA